MDRTPAEILAVAGKGVSGRRRSRRHGDRCAPRNEDSSKKADRSVSFFLALLRILLLMYAVLALMRAAQTDLRTVADAHKIAAVLVNDHKRGGAQDQCGNHALRDGAVGGKRNDRRHGAENDIVR